MDKKILFGGAAALIMAGSLVATPASASIELSFGGEAKLTAGFSECGPAATAASSLSDILVAAKGSALASADAAGAGAYIESVNTGVAANSADPAAITPVNTHIAGPCAGADRSGADWGFGKEITIAAEGTLANGLTVAFSDKIDLTDTAKEQGAFELDLGGAFGDLKFKDGAPSAVDAIMVDGKKDHDVNGTDLGNHDTETAGSAGMGMLWNIPSMGDLDLYIGYAPNSGNAGLDTASYENTFSIGASFDVSGVTIGAGYEAASAETAGACAAVATGDFVAGTAQGIIDTVFGGDYCGDQTLMYAGAAMSAGDIGINVSYSLLDTDEADKTVINVGASTTVSDYDVTMDYRSTVKEYEFGSVEDEQDVIAVTIQTALGDGVDLKGSFSTSDVSLLSETYSGGGDTDYYFAEASLIVGF